MLRQLLASCRLTREHPIGSLLPRLCLGFVVLTGLAGLLVVRRRGVDADEPDRDGVVRGGRADGGRAGQCQGRYRHGHGS